MSDPFMTHVLPFALLIVPVLFTPSVPRVAMYSLPLAALAFYRGHPEWPWAWIAIGAFWALYTVGHWRMAARSEIDLRWPVIVTLAAVSLVGGWLFVHLTGLDGKSTQDPILVLAEAAFVLFALLYLLLPGLIAPLIVRRRTPMTTRLADYYKEARSTAKGGQTWHGFIRFEGDPAHYDTGLLSFRRYRHRVGVPYTYVKCEGLFGVSFITRPRPLSDAPGRPSAWETAPETRKTRKVERIVLIFFFSAIAFALLVFGLAGLLWNE